MWSRYSDDFPESPQAMRVGPLARDIWYSGRAYCSRHLTDGVVPLGYVQSRVGYGVPDPLAEADKLIAAGLWDRTDEGFIDLRYAAECRSKALHQGLTEEAEIAKEAGRLIGYTKVARGAKGRFQPLNPLSSPLEAVPLQAVSNGPLATATVSYSGTRSRDLDPRGTPEIQVPGSIESADSMGTAVPPVPSPEESSSNGKSPYQRFVERLEGRGNVGAVLSDALVEFYGSAFPPQPARLVKLAKELNSKAAFLKLLVKCSTTWEGLDDPHDYLAASVQTEINGKHERRNGNGRGPPDGEPYLSDAELEARNRELYANQGATWPAPPVKHTS